MAARARRQPPQDGEGHCLSVREVAHGTPVGITPVIVVAIETIQADFRDLDRLKQRAEQVRSQGFSGMLAIHPAQIAVINAAFTPDPGQVAEARAIVAHFEANPSAETIGHEGAMLDRPHLSRVLRLLAQADR